MKKNSLVFLFAIAVLFLDLVPIAAQEHCIIVTFEESWKGDAKGQVEYHFLLREQNQLLPLFLPWRDSFCLDASELEESFLSKIRYPQDETIPIFPGGCFNDANGFFSSELKSISRLHAAGVLISMIHKYGKEVQMIKKKWKKRSYEKGFENKVRFDETIIVYITPVYGVFEKGWKYELSGDRYEYGCYSYTPVAIISYDAHFWETEEGTHCDNLDYSMFDYSKYMSREISSSENKRANPVSF